MIISIVGMNGSGKTTMCRLLAKQYPSLLFQPDYTKDPLIVISELTKKIIPFSSGELKEKDGVYIKKRFTIFHFMRYFLYSIFVMPYKFSKKIYLFDDRYPYSFLYMFEHDFLSSLYVHILKFIIPKPDLAFIFVNSVKKSYNIRVVGNNNEAFMNYKIDYFNKLYENYKKLHLNFKYTLLIDTEDYDGRVSIVQKHVFEFIHKLR